MIIISEKIVFKEQDGSSEENVGAEDEEVEFSSPNVICFCCKAIKRKKKIKNVKFSIDFLALYQPKNENHKNWVSSEMHQNLHFQTHYD